MTTYIIEGLRPDLSPRDIRSIWERVALELLRDPTYEWAMYERTTNQHLLLVRRELTAEHKKNLEEAYNVTLTKEG